MPWMTTILLQRAYDPPRAGGGKRVLVERLWPRGLSKDRAAIDLWIKGIAPSAMLRKWYGHDPGRWPEFRSRYRAELDAHPEYVRQIEAEIHGGPVTFVFGSREEQMNSANVLKEYLENRNP